MKYYFNLLIQIICFCPLSLLSQSDTVAFFDFEILKVEVDSKGFITSSIVNNHGEFQDAVPFKNLTVAYGNSHSYRNVEFGNYPVGRLFLYHSPSGISYTEKIRSFNHIELTLDSVLSPDKFYKFSFLIGNMKSHRFKPSHYGVKFSKDRIVKDGPGELLSEPDVFFSFRDDYELEEIQTILYFNQAVKYIYFGIFSEDSTRIPKKFPRFSPELSYSDTAAYIQSAKPTRIIIDNILIEELNTINKNLGNIYFDIDEDVVSKESDLQLINNLGEDLRNNPDSYLLIQGSTDNTGTFVYNMDLSRRRAENIKKIMVDSGVEENRIITLGNGVNQFGNTRTDASNARKAAFLLFH